MDHLVKLTRQGVTPEVTRPDPAKVIAGDPIHTTWNLEERRQAPADLPQDADKGWLYAGLWHTTAGEWQVSYAEWEYIRILEGLSVLTDETGQETRLAPGDSYLIRPGFKGTWRALEPTLKDYVILT